MHNPKIPEQIDILSEQVLLRCFFGDELTAGIELAIATTINNGYETSFEITKKQYGRQVWYPKRIFIGDKKATSNDGTAGHIRLGREFLAKGGSVSIWSDEHQKLVPTKEYLAFVDEQNRDGTGIFVDYPRISKKRKRGKHYPLIDIHTHPQGSATPSFRDVKTLDSLRTEWSGHLGFPYSPIMGIIGVNDSSNVPMFFFQFSEVFMENREDKTSSLSDRELRWMRSDMTRYYQLQEQEYWERYFPDMPHIRDFVQNTSTYFHCAQAFNRVKAVFDKENLELILKTDMPPFGHRYATWEPLPAQIKYRKL